SIRYRNVTGVQTCALPIYTAEHQTDERHENDVLEFYPVDDLHEEQCAYNCEDCGECKPAEHAHPWKEHQADKDAELCPFHRAGRRQGEGVIDLPRQEDQSAAGMRDS